MCVQTRYVYTNSLHAVMSRWSMCQLTQCVNVKIGAQASEECTRMHRLIPFFQVLFFVLRPAFFFFLVSLCCCFCFLSMNFSSLVFFNLKLNVSASKEAK